jgi:hypothetical protein
LQNFTCHDEGSHFVHHISQQVTCVPWINLVCFVFVLMKLYVIAAIFQLYRDDQSKLYWWIKQESTTDFVTVLYHKQIVHGTEGHMVVYGPVRHQQNIIWTEANDPK